MSTGEFLTKWVAGVIKALYKILTLVRQSQVFQNHKLLWEEERTEECWRPAVTLPSPDGSTCVAVPPAPVWVRTPSASEMRNARTETTGNVVPDGQPHKVDVLPSLPAHPLLYLDT